MTTKGIFISLVLLLLSSRLEAQTWYDNPNSGNGFDAYEGSMLPHMYSTIIWL